MIRPLEMWVYSLCLCVIPNSTQNAKRTYTRPRLPFRKVINTTACTHIQCIQDDTYVLIAFCAADCPRLSRKSRASVKRELHNGQQPRGFTLSSLWSRARVWDTNMCSGVYTITNGDADRTSRTMAPIVDAGGDQPDAMRPKIPYPRSIFTLLGSMFFERAAMNGMKSIYDF